MSFTRTSACGPGSGEDFERGARREGEGLDPCPELSAEAWSPWLTEDLQALAEHGVGEELLRRCAGRLADAWGDLNYRHLRSRLRPPSIMIHEGERRWGAWHPSRRLITISRRQVLCYTWESVVETLKHEMAHQFVSEALGGDGEPPHGPAFREACRLLACDAAARGDGGVPLFRPGGLGAGADPDDARLLRVHKLLRLADNNPDEHEARAAFARASELMLRYNLDPARTERPADYVARTIGVSSGRIPHHRYVIAGILQEFFFVQCIWVDSFVVHTGVRGHLLEVMGRRANVEMAEYVHDCLLRQCEALWLAFKRRHGLRDRAARREYVDGLLSGFRRQLRRTSADNHQRGLVWVGDAGLESFVRERHPRITRSRLDAVSASDVRAAGVRAGEQLRLHQPLGRGGPTGAPRHLLPG